MSRTRTVAFELPAEGIMSMGSIEQYANYADTTVEKWLGDAIAWYIRFHEEQRDTLACDALPIKPPERSALTRFKIWLAERVQRAADHFLDDGTYGEG
ncbi:MAG: hypothetical protein IJY96_01290 [Oscillospiraceae bacterium]|nr:hypothetical protein [Oscillospiraceae bacterium]